MKRLIYKIIHFKHIDFWASDQDLIQKIYSQKLSLLSIFDDTSKAKHDQQKWTLAWQLWFIISWNYYNSTYFIIVKEIYQKFDKVMNKKID